MKGAWSITVDWRPWTINEERRMHWSKLSEIKAMWRQRGAVEAKRMKIPPLITATLSVQPVIKDRKSEPDIGACMGAVKALVDGLVDAKVLPDDSGDYLTYIGFYPPEIGEKDAVILTIVGEPA